MGRSHSRVGRVAAFRWWWCVWVLWFLAAQQQASKQDGDSTLTIILGIVAIIGAAYGARRWWIGQHPLRLARKAEGAYPPCYELPQRLFPKRLRLHGLGEKSVLLQLEPRVEGEIRGVEIGLFHRWRADEALMPSLLNRKIPGIDEIPESVAGLLDATTHGRFRIPDEARRLEGGRIYIDLDEPMFWPSHEPMSVCVRFVSRRAWTGQIAIRARFGTGRAHVRQTVQVDARG